MKKSRIFMPLEEPVSFIPLGPVSGFSHSFSTEINLQGSCTGNVYVAEILTTFEFINPFNFKNPRLLLFISYLFLFDLPIIDNIRELFEPHVKSISWESLLTGRVPPLFNVFVEAMVLQIEIVEVEGIGVGAPAKLMIFKNERVVSRSDSRQSS